MLWLCIIHHVTETTIATDGQLQSITKVWWILYIDQKQATLIIIAVNNGIGR